MNPIFLPVAEETAFTVQVTGLSEYPNNAMGEALPLREETVSVFYDEQYGMEWPFGHHVRWERRNVSSLTVRFDSPWAPLSAELMGELSAMFDCEIRHWYSEASGSLKGYDCYDQGEHVDSGHGQSGRENRPALYLVTGEQAETELALPAIAVGQ